MSAVARRAERFTEAEIDVLFAGSGERLLAAYLRNALHTIAPPAVAYWAEVLAEALARQAARFAEDPDLAADYQALLEALQIDARRLS